MYITSSNPFIFTIICSSSKIPFLPGFFFFCFLFSSLIHHPCHPCECVCVYWFETWITGPYRRGSDTGTLIEHNDSSFFFRATYSFYNKIEKQQKTKQKTKKKSNQIKSKKKKIYFIIVVLFVSFFI